MARSVLQDELKKKHPFDCLQQEVHLNLLRTVDHLSREFVELFESHGLSAPQYNVLRILRGHRETGLPCQEISGQMITHQPDITRLVDRLEAAGLVTRRRTERDRRVVLVDITPAGLDVLARLDEPVLTLHKQQLKHFTRAELTELNRLLEKVRQPSSL